MGIEGTTFVVEEDGGASTLKVIDGTVRFTATSDGEGTTVEAGEMVRATAEGLSGIRTFDVDAEQTGWDELGAGEQVDAGDIPVWLLILIIVIALAVLGALVVIVTRGRRKRNSAGAMMSGPEWQRVQAGAPMPPGILCPACGGELSEGAMFCSTCGRPVAEPPKRERQTLFCAGCGSRLEEDTRFCTRCGKPV
ncbi:MAG: zinc ribbon domain-containing protein [Thermoleophilia bacterium]|nr:zinc ribbon domain-containing protein [Thermoleophilia bacterium]